MQSADITAQITVSLGCCLVPSLKCSSLFQGSPRWIPVLRSFPPQILLLLPPHQAPDAALGMSLGTAPILHYGLLVYCGMGWASSPRLSLLGLNLLSIMIQNQSHGLCRGQTLSHLINLLVYLLLVTLSKKNCFSFSQKKKKKIIFNDQLMLIDFCKDHQVPNSANRNLFGTRGTLLQMQFYLKNRNVSQCKSEFSDKLKGQTGFIRGMLVPFD